MSSSDGDSEERLHDSIIYLHRYVLPVFYVLGNIGNLFNALIFSRKSWKKNVCVFYFNMCLLANTFYINLVLLADIFTGFDIKPYDFNIVLCKLYFYVVYLFSILLPSILILASVDRLLVSSQNIDTRLYSSKRLAYLSVSLNTCFWFIFYIHIPIKANIQKEQSSHFDCYYDLSQSYLRFVTYSSLIINCCFSLIMIVLCMFAFKNVRHIRAIPRHKRHQMRTMTKKDFQLLRCLFVHDILYIILTVGYNIYTVYEAATIHQTRAPLEREIVEVISHFNESLHHIPYCISFYIYVIVSKAFRNALKRMIYQIFGKDLTAIHEEENRQEHAGRDNIEFTVAVINHIVL